MNPQPIRPDRVAIYIRWSTDDQGDGTTADVQRDGCKHYILSQGWQVTENLLFVDDGWSGGDLNRPGMNRLRASIAAGAVDCVVLFKIDRLSRNVVDTVNLVLREWEGRCYVKSAREAIDTTTAAGKMFFYTLVSFAEWERSVIRDRTLSGKLRRLQEGKNPGFRPPYGLAVGDSPGTFVRVAAEGQVVTMIFELYLSGNGYKAIATALNERAIRFREGRPFSARTVYEILCNPIYTGKLVYGRRMTNPRKATGGARQVKNPALPIVVDETGVPPLVSEATFAQAQALRVQKAEARKPNRSLTSEHLLTSILRCRCGSSMIGLKGSTPYYACSGKRNKGSQFCRSAHIRQDVLDAWVVERLLERHGSELGQERYLSWAGARASSAKGALQASLDGLEHELTGLEKELAVIARDYRRELLSLAEYREQRQLIDQRRLELDARRKETSEQLQHLETQTAKDGLLQAQLAKVDRWGLLPFPERKLLVRQLVSSLWAFLAPGSGELQIEVAWMVGDLPSHGERG